MTITLIGTKGEGRSTECVWQNEVGQTFTVAQYETAVSDFEDFSDIYARRADFKALSSSELEAFYNALEAIEQADPNNLRGYKGK